jgi:hypothetical protein
MTELQSPVNHVFVDFENVHEIAPGIIGSKAVSFTLLLGSRQTKLEASLVEKLLEHAASVQLVRLTSPGKNALDFALAYYLGRAVAADPTGSFHIVSKDAGYDPLIEHLRSRHIRARRHDNFATLTFAETVKLPIRTPLATAPRQKPQAKPEVQLPLLEERATQVLEHLRKASTNRPRNRKKLVSFISAHLGQNTTEAEASNHIESLRLARQLDIDEKGAVSYHLEHE